MHTLIFLVTAINTSSPYSLSMNSPALPYVLIIFILYMLKREFEVQEEYLMRCAQNSETHVKRHVCLYSYIKCVTKRGHKYFEHKIRQRKGKRYPLRRCTNTNTVRLCRWAAITNIGVQDIPRSFPAR